MEKSTFSLGSGGGIGGSRIAEFTGCVVGPEIEENGGADEPCRCNGTLLRGDDGGNVDDGEGSIEGPHDDVFAGIGGLNLSFWSRPASTAGAERHSVFGRIFLEEGIR
ncbi:hypothetical protein CISG_02859 [Coccidioides immitis RMSCC 3703]|uniref:Uncharacterized protein n=1 Tax=Coccidioides immitis RMSCC 3703 TaxID=454286 RepID=A0A0J8RD65_COCIT|nr:hypothetical protein CISG_02859 [Coccidioides immitis RMSCC 3703]